MTGVQRVRARFRRFAFPRHVHDVYSIGLVERGVNRFSHRGAQHCAPQGTICVVNPDEPHTGVADDEGWTYTNLYVAPDTLRRVLGIERGLGFRRSVCADARAVAALRRLHAAPPGDPEPGLVSALGELARWAGLIRLDEEVGGSRLEEARRRLGAVVDRPLRVTDLASELGVSPPHLVRSFTRAYGISPYAYHLARRVAAAQQLVADGVPLAEVALATGFADQAHLTRHFRRLVGLTPGALRR